MSQSIASRACHMLVVATCLCLLQVYNLTGESAEFEQFLYDPSVPKNKKVPALNAILDKMEVNEVTKHFFGEYCRLEYCHVLSLKKLDGWTWHMQRSWQQTTG